MSIALYITKKKFDFQIFFLITAIINIMALPHVVIITITNEPTTVIGGSEYDYSTNKNLYLGFYKE